MGYNFKSISTVQKIPTPKNHHNAWDNEQLERIYSLGDDKKQGFGSLFRFLYQGACRVQDAAGLKFSDFQKPRQHPTNRTLCVMQLKGKKSRMREINLEKVLVK